MKLGDQAPPVVMLAYGTMQKVYKHWDSTLGKAVISRDVVFEECSRGRAHAGSLSNEILPRGFFY